MPESTYISTTLKQFVMVRAYYCCEYCLSQARYCPDSFSFEHIISVSSGGATSSENLAYSCQGCNNHKYTHTTAIDPVTRLTVPLYNPRQHIWKEHFAWYDDYALMMGLTPMGRATIAKLQLNREGVVNLRRVLRSVNRHPPIGIIL